jgi:hypothetical protein
MKTKGDNSKAFLNKPSIPYNSPVSQTFCDLQENKNHDKEIRNEGMPKTSDRVKGEEREAINPRSTVHITLPTFKLNTGYCNRISVMTNDTHPTFPRPTHVRPFVSTTDSHRR